MTFGKLQNGDWFQESDDNSLVTTYIKISSPDQSIIFWETPIKISPLKRGFGFAVNMRSGIVLEFMDNKTVYPTEKPETIISKM